MALILIRFGEISLKSPRIRRQFSKTLINNIQRMFSSAGLECFTWEEWGRIFIETNDFEKAAALLTHAFGVVSFSEVIQVDCVQETINAKVLEVARGMLGPGTTFAIRCRRAGNHAFTSQEMAAKVGEAVLDANVNLGLKVDLRAPQVRIDIEVRDNKAYIFTNRREGPGGMPLSTQGGVFALVEPRDLEDPVRSACAFYLLMKRGCKVFPACLYPEGAGGAGEQRLVELLRRFDPDIRMRHLDKEMHPDEAAFQILEKEGVLAVAVTPRMLQDGFFKVHTTVFYPLIGLESGYLETLRSKVMSG